MTKRTIQKSRSAEALEVRYREYLCSLRRRDGSLFSKKYVYDKMSRFRLVLDLVGIRRLSDVSDSNFLNILDIVVERLLTDPAMKSRSGRHADYTVVVRQLYDMNNKKRALRYTHYRGEKRN